MSVYIVERKQKLNLMTKNEIIENLELEPKWTEHKNKCYDKREKCEDVWYFSLLYIYFVNNAIMGTLLNGHLS